LGPNSGFVLFAASHDAAFWGRNGASRFCCAYNDEHKQQDRPPNENSIKLSFMGLPLTRGTFCYKQC
jgi:hypothetical protein